MFTQKSLQELIDNRKRRETLEAKTTTFRIRCTRSASSMFGPATAYMKSNGREIVWHDRDEAEKELELLRAKPTNNVFYTLEESN